MMRRGCIPRSDYGSLSDALHSKAQRQRIPIDGMLELTARCNLRCKHCYVVPDKEKQELTTDQVKYILDEITAAGCLWLGLTGGEILVRPDFIEIYRYAKAKGLLVSLLTNATLIDDTLIRCLKAYPPHQVEISLYAATEAVHACVTGVSGMLEAALRGIGLLRQNRIAFNLKTAVTRDNAHEIPRISDLARRMKAQYRYDPHIHARIDGSRRPWDFRLGAEAIVAMELRDPERLADWKRYCDQYWGRIRYDSYFYCASLLNSFHIDAYGRLVACILCRSQSECVLESPFLSCWNRLYDRVQNIKCDPAFPCARCDLAYLCDHCAGWAEVENGRWDKNAEFLCRLSRLRYKEFLENGILDPAKRGIDEEKICAA